MLIRQATIYELDELRSFYNNYWGWKHPLINIREYTEYYFNNGKKINFIIARENENTEIVSACGYILTNSTKNPDAWITLLLTKKGVGSSIGLQIVDYIANNLNIRILSSNNIRPNTLKLYKFLGYDTAEMNHYYRLSNDDNYSVAVISNRKILSYRKSAFRLQLLRTPQDMINTFNTTVLLSNKPYKDINYITRRYYNCPFYSYYVYGIFDEHQSCNALIVMRKADINNASVLRIVDLIGKYDNFALIGRCIDGLLKQYNCEYVDFYCYGLKNDILQSAGFSKREENDKNVIPNYLEPYLPKNVDFYLFSNDITGFTMFRADGDQDKPNIELN